MSALAWLTCKAFITKQTPQEQKHLLNFLPKSTRLQLDSLRFVDPNWIESKFSLEDVLDLVHPLWILPLLISLTSQEIGFTLAALQPDQASALKSQLNYPWPLPSLTRLGRAYLRHDLLNKIPGIPDLAPSIALPESPLNLLVSLSFKQLLELIFLLGFRDLGQYLKLVIDKNKRNLITSALSPKEWQIVQQFAAMQDPLAGGKDLFDAWNGQPDKLRVLIEQRGINRLAKALSEEHPSLIWYVLHILDPARGNFLHKLCIAPSSKSAQTLLKQQVIDTARNL